MKHHDAVIYSKSLIPGVQVAVLLFLSSVTGQGLNAFLYQFPCL